MCSAAGGLLKTLPLGSVKRLKLCFPVELVNCPPCLPLPSLHCVNLGKGGLWAPFLLSSELLLWDGILVSTIHICFK